MAEVLVTFNDLITGPQGTTHVARACGREMPDGRWEGWIEFEATDGSDVLRSGRETTQPNRTDTVYWATGLTPVYLDGALARALDPVPVKVAAIEDVPVFDGPRPPGGDETAPRGESVLNPFAVARKGEPHLRRQLSALAAWHLVNIIEAHGLSDLPADAVARLTTEQLIELIVAGVRLRTAEEVEP